MDIRFEQKMQGRTKHNISALSAYEESTFLLSGNSRLFNQCSLEIPINGSFSPFLLMPCCVPQSPQGSCVSFCPHLPRSLVSDGVGQRQMEDQFREVQEPFPPKDGKHSGLTPCFQT